MEGNKSKLLPRWALTRLADRTKSTPPPPVSEPRCVHTSLPLPGGSSATSSLFIAVSAIRHSPLANSLHHSHGKAGLGDLYLPTGPDAVTSPPWRRAPGHGHGPGPGSLDYFTQSPSPSPSATTLRCAALERRTFFSLSLSLSRKLPRTGEGYIRYKKD